MTATQLNLPLPSQGLAVLTLPQPLTQQSLLELEQALFGQLNSLHHALFDPAPDPGQLEYASWMRQLSPTHALLHA
ncbi:hypothetical protein [Hydrogenophaga sp. OTU3427]|uniref:hypothetical protein n=1 Tax=Hydrogenophaga sp. OTU3427 TaxID=3043856 RepID=UPI00313CFE9F